MESPVNVEVGKYYLVPSAMHKNGKRVIPIIYPAHSDGREICVDPVDNHFHIDKRFVRKPTHDVFLGSFLRDFALRKFRCRRKSCFLVSPSVFMVERLHRLYQHRSLINGHCPHQGSRILNPCGTCQNHHLIWDLQTKRLKHKLPFFLKIGNNKGEIHERMTSVTTHSDDARDHVFCDITIIERIHVPHILSNGDCVLRLYLYDKDDQPVNEMFHDQRCSVVPQLGDTISVKDCSLPIN